MRKELALFGAAVSEGQRKPGTELAPNWLKLKGLKEVLTRKFFQVDDLGDFNPEPVGPNGQEKNREQRIEAMARFTRNMGQALEQQLNSERMAVVIGGDHSCALGSLAGALAYDPNMKVIWVDAHADINTFETSPSGNIHGMPVAFFLDLISDEKARGNFSEFTKLRPENIVYIGLRDVDAGERKFLEDLNILNFSAEDVRQQGMSEVLKKSHEHLDSDGKSNFYISFDVDALDPSFVPSTGTPVPGGLDLFDAKMIIDSFARTNRLCCLDIVEVNPLLGDEKDLEMTAASTLELMEAIPSWWELEATSKENIFDQNSNFENIYS